MESRTLQLLEFPKVLKRLASYAASEPGETACLALSPLDDDQAIAAQGALLRQAVLWRGEASFSLSEFPSLAGMFHYLAAPTAVLDVDALYATGQVLGQLTAAREALAPFADRDWDELFSAVEGLPWPERTVAGIRRCIDADGLIRDQSSPELMEVREAIRAIHRRCTKQVKDYLSSENIAQYMQDEFMTISSDRYVLPLKVGYKNRLSGIIHDYSQTGETCYFEPMFLVETNNRLQELKREEREEERKVLTYLTNLCRAEEDSLRAAYAGLVGLDVLMAKCALAQALGGGPIDVEPGCAPRLFAARHPLLALAGEAARPVDIELGDEHRALIISGGNAGGKTVCLKTLGLSALMAYSGLPVAAAEGSALPLFSSIHVILGDEQSLEENVSTFTAQIRHLGSAYAQAGPNALFLLDEFGAGTDPTQGAALAQAVVDALLAKGATIVAATHFPALKVYAMATDGVRAASVLFDPDTKRPLFRLAYDQVGASIALDVAREHGLPEEILSRAEQNLLLDGTDTSQVLDKLNALAVRRERELDDMERERRKMAEKRARLDEKFDKERKELISEVRAQSRTILQEWKDGRAGRKATLKKLAESRDKLAREMAGPEQAAEEALLAPQELREGMDVAYAAWGKTGTIVELDLKRKRAKVDIGGVAMWLDAADLAPASGPAPKPRNAGGLKAAPAAPADAPALSLDLRGQRADEAVSALERFVDQALLRGAGRLEIIHGRGTGALRREVHEFLRHSPGIGSFATAPEDRGGDGMTEVTLK